MKRILLRTLVGTAALILFAGCNLLQLPFFIFGPEPTLPPKLQRLATDNEDETIYVAILTHVLPQERADAALENLDRELSAYVARHLRAGIDYNKENVKVIDPRKVLRFQTENPDWKSWGNEEIGEQLKADYVVSLEVRNIRLRSYHSSDSFLRGHAEINVDLTNVTDPDKSPLSGMTCVVDYPKKGAGIELDFDVSKAEFKQKFLDVLGKRLSWYFTKHRRIDSFGRD